MTSSQVVEAGVQADVHGMKTSHGCEHLQLIEGST